MNCLTKTKALKKLSKMGLGRVRAERLLKSGQIKPVSDGKTLLYPEWSLELWSKNTIPAHQLNLPSEVVYTTSQYQQSSTATEYSFEKVRTQRTNDKLSNTQTKDSTNLSTKQSLDPILVN